MPQRNLAVKTLVKTAYGCGLMPEQYSPACSLRQALRSTLRALASYAPSCTIIMEHNQRMSECGCGRLRHCQRCICVDCGACACQPCRAKREGPRAPRGGPAGTRSSSGHPSWRGPWPPARASASSSAADGTVVDVRRDVSKQAVAAVQTQTRAPRGTYPRLRHDRCVNCGLLWFIQLSLMLRARVPSYLPGMQKWPPHRQFFLSGLAPHRKGVARRPFTSSASLLLSRCHWGELLSRAWL